LGGIYYLCRPMASTRQEKVARLLQKELATIMQQFSRTHFGGALITVTSVRPSPDMGVAKIYLSLFLTNDKPKLMADIIAVKNEIRRALGMQIGKQMRVVPELAFFLDDSIDYLENIERLLK